MSSSELAAIDTAEAWAFVEWQMWWHNKGSDTWLDTINRLIRKKEFLSNRAGDKIHRDELPLIDRHNLAVSRESWPLQDLFLALDEEAHHDSKVICDECPILVIRLSDAAFLLDGTHRVNRRILNEQHGAHDVIVVSYIPG